jgi:CHAD domain-containing protein
MKMVYHIKSKESLKDNIKNILPSMFDDFFSLKDEVVSYPLRKNALHRMRISGKPLRYTMEIGEYAFGSEFKKCFGEVKNAIELMGEIHGADVMIPEINLHIKEIILFNRTMSDSAARFSTKNLRDFIAELKNNRLKMYSELCEKLNNWQNSNFKSRLAQAMETRTLSALTLIK